MRKQNHSHPIGYGTTTTLSSTLLSVKACFVYGKCVCFEELESEFLFFLFVWRLESEFLSSPFSGGIKRVFNVGISVYAFKYPCAMQASMQLLLVYAITLGSKCP